MKKIIVTRLKQIYLTEYIIISFAFVLLFISCKNPQNNYEYTEIDSPAEIAERAYRFAELYAESETEYELGGQDPARAAIKIDCSGLIIMCYKYAVVDTKYSLIQSDMTANYMYKNASTIIKREELKKGNLLFMGEQNSDTVSHIAIFEKEENGIIYFIDSTQKDIDGDNIYDINGVTRRQYNNTDKRFKAFGIMKLKY